MRDADGIRLPFFVGVFIDSLAPHFSEVVLFLHEPATGASEDDLGYRLRSRNVRLVTLGRRIPVYVRVLMAPRYMRIFRAHARAIDVMLFRVSTPLLPFAARYFPRRMLYFVSHASRGVEHLEQPPLRHALIKAWTRFYARREARIASRSPVVTNSPQLQTELSAELGREVPLVLSTTLSASDIPPPAVRPLRRPVRLLYVGRISGLKGIIDVLDALAALRARGIEATLTLAGELADEPVFRRELSERLEKQGLRDVVTFTGFVQGGRALWALYREADIFVIASRESEGSPRVIWEAMANSTPVVATRVGSMPLMGGGAIEVAEPKDPASLAAAIERVIRDEHRRHDMVRRGWESVKENTLENRGRELATLLAAQR